MILGGEEAMVGKKKAFNIMLRALTVTSFNLNYSEK